MATLSELRQLFKFGTDYTLTTPFATYQTAIGQNLLEATASTAWTDLWNIPGGSGRQHQDFNIILNTTGTIGTGAVTFEGSPNGASAAAVSLDFNISAMPTGLSNGASTSVAGIVQYRVNNPLGFRYVRVRISTAYTGTAPGVRIDSANYAPKNLFAQILRSQVINTVATNLSQIGGSTLTAGAGVVAGGTQRIVHATGANGATTSVTAATAATSLLAAGATRLGVTIFNDSTSEVCILLGVGTVSLTNYTIRMSPNGYYEIPPAFAGLKVDGIWVTANGSAKITTVN